jgi:DNA-binding response OmpR family regulator
LLYLAILLIIGREIYRQIEQKRKQEAEEEKMRFLINATHDIRSPLTLILGPLKKLRVTANDTESQNYINTIDRNAQRLLLLVNQILDERKIDKNQMHLHCQETDLVAFIASIKALFQFNAEQRGIKYTFEHDEPKLMAWVDRSNFDKVVSNLLANAFKYVRENGEIKIVLSKTGSHAVMKVIDSGAGFKDVDTKKLFDRFYQGPGHAEGSGIGLNLSKAIVNLHGGSIKAYNRTDGGTGACLEVQIPLGTNHLKPEEIERNQEQENASKNASTGKANTNIKVMVVDDDHEVTAYIKSELSQWYRIDTFQDGKEALEALLKGSYDIVVSDVIMPQMDGIALLKHIKGNTQVSHIPVVLLTSKAEVSDRLEGLREGADAFLAKPFNMEELHVLIDQLIANFRRLRGKFSGALEQKDLREEVDVKGADAQFMERIMKSVNENLPNSEFNVERLAADTGVSRAQLHRKMKEITGISPSDFIRNIRLEEAARLIRENKTNLSQVAYAVGFTNQSHFSTIFKKQYGMPPSEYAAKFMNKNENTVQEDKGKDY